MFVWTLYICVLCYILLLLGFPFSNNHGGSIKECVKKPKPLQRRSLRRRKKDSNDSLKKKTLVLDLDETLIHSTSRGSRKHDFVVEVMIDRHPCLYYVYKRPFVDLFLKQVSEWFKVVVFTASLREYADPVIDWLDTENIVSERYFRESCTPFLGVGYHKNLDLVEFDKSQVVIVDNSTASFAFNQENGIPITPWIDDLSDQALLDLLVLLDGLRFVDDVRSVLMMQSSVL